MTAELSFDAEGRLVDFASEDRGMLGKDGRLRLLRWTTPLGEYREIGGWTVATEGEAIWHLPEGPFTYGRMQLTAYAAR